MFALQFPADSIAELAARYQYEDDEHIEKGIGPDARERGYYTHAEFLEICNWKTSRSRPHFEKNGAALVGEVVQYEDTYRLCYIRGPEGILIGLAQELDNKSATDVLGNS